VKWICDECGAGLVATSRHHLSCPKGHGGLVPLKDARIIAPRRGRRNALCERLPEAEHLARMCGQALYRIDEHPGFYRRVYAMPWDESDPDPPLVRAYRRYHDGRVMSAAYRRALSADEERWKKRAANETTAAAT